MATQLDKNFARLRETANANLAFTNRQNLESAKVKGDYAINQAKTLANFSSTAGKMFMGYQQKLQEKKDLEDQRFWHEWDAKKQKIENEKAAVKAELAKIDKEDANYVKYHNILNKLGTYQQAQKASFIAALSPRRQTIFAKQDLENFNKRLPALLKQRMMNSTLQFEHDGVNFSPSEVHKDASALSFKRASIQPLINQIAKEQGIFNYTDAFLAAEGTRDAMIKSRDDLLNQYEQEFAIDQGSKLAQLGAIEFF